MLSNAGINDKFQKGFTLLEVLIAIAVTGLIAVGIAGAIFQVFNVNASSTNHVIVIKQVESALHWLSRDAQMAQEIQPGGGSGFPLSLSWVEWDNSAHQISYAVENKRLYRSDSVNGGEPSRMMVADYIDAGSDSTNCQFVDGVLSFRVTASITGYKPDSETRVIQVIPRSVP